MKWISVNQRLPDGDTKILCYEPRCQISIMDFDLENKRFRPLKGSGRWIRIVGVTHWMPLPSPPRNKEKTIRRKQNELD